MNRDKALDRASKLQAQMESEHALGNQDAAEAFAGLMSRLVLEHALHQDEITAHRAAGTIVPEEPIIEVEVDLERAGIERKHRRDPNLEYLALIVARAHLCKHIIWSHSNRLAFVGTARHCEVSEYMLTTMWRALGQLARTGKLAALRAGVETRGYTQTFREHFLHALSVRYQDEQKAVVREQRTGVVDTSTQGVQGGTTASDAGEQTALVCLRKAMVRVEQFVDSRYGHKRKARCISTSSRNFSSAGAADGRAAASRVNLRANGIGGGTSRRELSA